MRNFAAVALVLTLPACAANAGFEIKSDHPAAQKTVLEYDAESSAPIHVTTHVECGVSIDDDTRWLDLNQEYFRRMSVPGTGRVSLFSASPIAGKTEFLDTKKSRALGIVIDQSGQTTGQSCIGDQCRKSFAAMRASYPLSIERQIATVCSRRISADPELRGYFGNVLRGVLDRQP